MNFKLHALLLSLIRLDCCFFIIINSDASGSAAAGRSPRVPDHLFGNTLVVGIVDRCYVITYNLRYRDEIRLFCFDFFVFVSVSHTQPVHVILTAGYVIHVIARPVCLGLLFPLARPNAAKEKDENI